MNHSPARLKLSMTLIILAFLLAPLSSSSNVARAQEQKRQGSETQAAGSPIPAIIDVGSSILTSAARFVQADPYAEFRAARYSNAGLLNERDELKLGAQLHAEVLKRYKIVQEGQPRVSRIGQMVARKSLRPGLNYRFYVIREREINAFSGPGGYVYVTTALLKLANDDELASVLSHEVGHVVARHSLKALQNSQALGGIADLVGSITGIAGETAEELGKTAAQIVGSGLLAVHSREEEREADFLGVRAMPKAGFNPEGMVTMFEQLQSLSRSDSSILGTLFSDHPDVQERIDNTRYEISRMRRNASGAGGR
ncbi:MAG TPA: M48 family metallopeptidase [Pyrinomonadaceae bacterium]